METMQEPCVVSPVPLQPAGFRCLPLRLKHGDNLILPPDFYIMRQYEVYRRAKSAGYIRSFRCHGSAFRQWTPARDTVQIPFFRDVSFEVQDHNRIGLVGVNGSGKNLCSAC